MTTVDTYLFLINSDIPAEITAAATQMMMSSFRHLKRKNRKFVFSNVSSFGVVLSFMVLKIDDAKVMFRCLFCRVYFLSRTMMLAQGKSRDRNDAS